MPLIDRIKKTSYTYMNRKINIQVYWKYIPLKVLFNLFLKYVFKNKILL